MVQGSRLISTVAGLVERVNKLVAVLPIRARYSAEVGDVVVGRIRDVVSRKWKVDVNARQDAVLLLSAVNLPGGVQRRRTYEDELKMREFFDQDDLISAEVQEV
jgi:exosome complex component RRP4